MDPEAFLGGLMAIAVFGFLAYFVVMIAWELMTGRGTSRQDMADNLKRDPLGSLLNAAFVLVTVAFLGLVAFGGLIFTEGKSDLYLWLPAAILVLGVLTWSR